MTSLIRGRFRWVSETIMKQIKGGYFVPCVVIKRKWTFSRV